MKFSALLSFLVATASCVDGKLSSPSPVRAKMRSSPSSTGKLRQVASGGAMNRRAEVGLYFTVWYALNVMYNIQNKKVLRLVDLPWTVATAQLVVGAIYAQMAWLLGRPRPRDLAASMREIKWIALCHGAGQASTVIALGAGAVSSAHVIKALEPLFSAAVTAVVSGTLMDARVYASLLPVVGGVALAVAKDLQFSPLSFSAAMSSNLLFACRAVFSKRAMQRTLAGAFMSPASLFGVVTTASALAMIPVAAAFEGNVIMPRIRLATTAPSCSRLSLLGFTISSGLFHYLNNEVMYLTLGKVHPVTLAVGNTIKRIVIILASLAVLGESMQPLAALGATIAIGGTFCYSLLKQRLG